MEAAVALSSKEAKALDRKHFPRREDLTEYQLKKIAELRHRIHDLLHSYPEYNTDFEMLRWLHGWDYDIDAIVPKARFVLETFLALRTHQLPFMKPEDINTFGRSLSPAADYFPMGIMGTDEEGNLLVVQAGGKFHPKTFCNAGTVSEFFRNCIIVGEAGARWLRHREELEGKKLGGKLIMDLDGFSMDLLYMPTLKIYMNQLSLLQMCFPDQIRAIFVVNCPTMIQAAYTVIQPVIAKQTRDKIHFLGSDWKAKVIQELGEPNVYPQWGGTKSSPNGKPTGDISMGGRVPEKILYCKERNPLDDDKGFATFSVSAGSKKEHKVTAHEGDTLRWLFRVSSGDIDFSIIHNGVMV